MLAKFLYSQPLFLGDNRLLHIGYDLVILCAVLDSFMDFVAYRRAFEINGATSVLSVFKDIPDGRLFPPIRILRDFLCVFSADGFKVGGGDKDLFVFKPSCNLHRSISRKTQGIDFSYHFGGRLVNQPFFYRSGPSYTQTEQ